MPSHSSHNPLSLKSEAKANMVKTIGIIGGGTVGRATARCYMEWADVRIYDICKSKSTHTLDEVIASDIVFICLPTPAARDGLSLLDVSQIDDFCNVLGGSKPDGVYILKSTVPTGTTRTLAEKYRLPHLIHSPEFLTGRCALVDAQLPSRNIIGTVNGETSSHGFRTLSELLTRRFPGVPLLWMSSDESETVKLAVNSFFAVKISFFNEMFSLCEKLGLEWESIVRGILSDGRIAHSHTRVPGPDGSYGYGGGCLVKDSDCLRSIMTEAGLSAAVLTGAAERNKKDRCRR